MHFRLLFILVLIVDHSWCNDPKKEDLDNVPTKGIEAVEQTPIITIPNICDECNCTDNSIECTTWDCSKTFEDYYWPNKTWEVVSFKDTSLNHVTAFPALSIKKLIFFRNKIHKIDGKSFGNLIDLMELDFTHNVLTSENLHPNAFEGKFAVESYEPLKKLRVLNLSYNLLHSLDQATFEHIPDLKILNLRGNPFMVIDIPTNLAISDIPRLEELDLSYCDINSMPHHIFHMSHKHLNKLDISGNKLTAPPSALEYAKSLKVLTLDNNPIEFIGRTNAFPDLPELEELNLRNMFNLIRIGSGAFSKLKNLKILRVHNCSNLIGIDEKALVHNDTEGALWPALKKLIISNNALRYLPERFVERWDRLEELDLINNQWSCDCDNQYLIGSLLPALGRQFMGENVNELKCKSPPEHFGENLISLASRKLRCLDIYKARPEKDAAILVGMLIGLLLTIPIGSIFILLWRRGYFFCSSKGPASFSRAFYRRTPADEI